MNVSVLQMFKTINTPNHSHRSTHIVDELVRLGLTCERRKSMTANQINYQNLQEMTRHNVSTEFEAVRSNVAREIENNRHNVVGEVETGRHNIAGEYELNRHNVTWEKETSLHNRISENETGRHNRASEGIGYAQVSLGYSQLAELARHNQTTEQLQDSFQVNDWNLRSYSNMLRSEEISVDKRNAATREKEARTHKYQAQTGRKEASTHTYQAKTGRIGTIWDGVLGTLDLFRKGNKDAVDTAAPLFKLLLK